MGQEMGPIIKDPDQEWPFISILQNNLDFITEPWKVMELFGTGSGGSYFQVRMIICKRQPPRWSSVMLFPGFHALILSISSPLYTRVCFHE